MDERCRVVIADDSADFREVLRRVLEHDGHFEVVGEAANGNDALEVVRGSHPDLVVLDLSMPGRGGRAVAPLIRAVAPKTRVVVLSGFVPPSGKDPGLDVDAALDKGAGLDRIVTVLQRVANGDPVPTRPDDVPNRRTTDEH